MYMYSCTCTFVCLYIQGVSSVRQGIFNKKCLQANFFLGVSFFIQRTSYLAVVKKKVSISQIVGHARCTVSGRQCGSDHGRCRGTDLKRQMNMFIGR